MQKQILHILRVFIRACYLFSYYQFKDYYHYYHIIN